MTGMARHHRAASGSRRLTRIAAEFRGIDWSFADSVVTPPHDIHSYPARFIPELPRSALDLVKDVPGAVLDPFCGAGTTLVEAVRSGRDSVGIDLNPIATLISRVKVQRWGREDDRVTDSYAVGLRWAAANAGESLLREARERIPRLDHWFTPDAQRALAGASDYMRVIEDPVWRDRVALSISASVVRLSRQDSDTRYAAVDRPMDIDLASRVLERALVKIADQLRAFAPEHAGSHTRVVTGDAASLSAYVRPQTVAAAIFSPPYPNAYEYWLYHKYRMYWLGFDPIAVRAGEWGARPHYSGSGRATIETFAQQMAPVLAAVERALSPDGMCLIVVGDSRIKGEIVDNASLFERIATDAGLVQLARTSRPIRAGRKSFNLTNARATHEHVLLFSKR